MNFKTICAECEKDVLPIVKKIDEEIHVAYKCICGCFKTKEVPETFKAAEEEGAPIHTVEQDAPVEEEAQPEQTEEAQN